MNVAAGDAKKNAELTDSSKLDPLISTPFFLPAEAGAITRSVIGLPR